MALSSENNAQLIDQILGSTLGALVKAQSLMSSQLAELINRVGFEEAAGTQPMRPRTFNFAFQRNEVNETTGQTEKRDVNVTLPLLSIINLPSLSIDEATIALDLDWVAHEEAAAAPPTPAGRPAAPALARPLKLFAVPARKQLRTPSQPDTSGPAASLKIKITVRRQDAMGLQKLQNLLDSAYLESEGPAKS